MFAAEPNVFLVSEAGALEPGAALDLGCGQGRNAVWLAERGWKVTGVDFSEFALRRAAGFAESRGVEVEWVAADLSSYRPPEGRFGLVIVMYLHLPWQTMRKVLAAGAAAVAPGGTMLVVGHHRDNLGSGTPGPSNPGLLHDPGEVAEALGGLAADRADRVTQAIEVDGEVRIAVDSLVRAHRPA